MIFGHSADKNLAAWREFRKSFNGNETDCVEAFASIPVQPRYIDYYTRESWPSIFEIVADNMLCQSGLTLVMAATLYDLKFINNDKVHLQVVSNHITGKEGLVLKHNNKVYNFLPGEVVTDEFCEENSTTYDTYVIAVDKLI